MSLNKVASWFLTDKGKKFSYFFAGAVSTGVLLAHTLPHTIFLDKYQDVVRLYKNGFSVPLSAKLSERFQKTIDLIGVDSQDKHLFKPFTVYGFDIFSAGSSYSKYGVIVGLPVNFTYEDTTSVDKSIIKLRDDSINWELPEGKALLDSFILSENAQIYAIAREIKFRETPKLLIDTVTSVITCIGTYGLCNSLNTRFNYYAKPLIFRAILYSIVGAFTLGSFILCKDLTQVYYEEKIDKELIKLNPLFVSGGQEYYSKILTRNVTLRQMLGKEGEKMYSSLGNELALFRHRHIPLVQRKMLFEQSA